MSQTQLGRVESSYENASTITDLDAHEMLSYPMVFDMCSVLSGQLVLNPDERIFFLEGKASVIVDGDTNTTPFKVGNKMYGKQHQNVKTTKTRVIDDFGERNPFQAQEYATPQQIFGVVTNEEIQDIVIDTRGVVRSIPSDVARSFVPRGTNVQPPTEVYVIDRKFGTDSNKGKKGEHPFDTKEHCRTVLRKFDIDEETLTFINKRLRGLMWMDQFFFDNGLSHDDLVGSDAYGNFVQWYVTQRPWKDCGVPRNYRGVEYELVNFNGTILTS